MLHRGLYSGVGSIWSWRVRHGLGRCVTASRTELVVIAGNLNAMRYREDILLPHVVHRKNWQTYFIDLAKAFDTLDHSILVGQLRSIGVSEGSLGWFANYLSQRVLCIT